MDRFRESECLSSTVRDKDAVSRTDRKVISRNDKPSGKRQSSKCSMYSINSTDLHIFSNRTWTKQSCGRTQNEYSAIFSTDELQYPSIMEQIETSSMFFTKNMGFRKTLFEVAQSLQFLGNPTSHLKPKPDIVKSPSRICRDRIRRALQHLSLIFSDEKSPVKDMNTNQLLAYTFESIQDLLSRRAQLQLAITLSSAERLSAWITSVTHQAKEAKKFDLFEISP